MGREGKERGQDSVGDVLLVTHQERTGRWAGGRVTFFLPGRCCCSLSTTSRSAGSAGTCARSRPTVFVLLRQAEVKVLRRELVQISVLPDLRKS